MKNTFAAMIVPMAVPTWMNIARPPSARDSPKSATLTRSLTRKRLRGLMSRCWSLYSRFIMSRASAVSSR